MVRLLFAVTLGVVPSASAAASDWPASFSIDDRTLEHVRALGAYRSALDDLEASIGSTGAR